MVLLGASQHPSPGIALAWQWSYCKGDHFFVSFVRLLAILAIIPAVSWLSSPNILFVEALQICTL